MKIPGYNIDLEKAVKIINKNSYKRVALQLPEGLKTHFTKLVEYLENETNANIIISADPCFGACDIANSELKDLGVEYIVQIGHTQIPNIKDMSIPTIFLNALSTKDITQVVEKSIPKLVGKRIGIVTTAQHLHTLDNLKELLAKNNFKPVIGRGDKRISTNGQILGCNFSTGTSIKDEVDSYLFIGSGTFHPLGLSLSTGKTVVAADPYTNEVKKEEITEQKDLILRQRYGAIARSKDAKQIGILISIKQGQQRMELANKLKELLDINQKKSYIIVLDKLSPDLLQGFTKIDCFVSTACPRVAIDDYIQYKIPIITSVELEILLGLKKWEEYTFDQILS